MLRGIDVSRWQGLIGWDQVKTGADFALIKLGGSDDGFYTDGQAIRNAKEARRVGIPHGFYFYLGGVHDTDDEVQHIKNCIAQIGGLQQGEVIALDWEEHTDDEVGYVSSIARKIIDFGFPPPLFYASLSRVRSANWKPLVDLNMGLWVAAWGDNDALPEPLELPGVDEWPFWAVWQFSSNGKVPGIAGNVDLNQFNGDTNAFRKYGMNRTQPANGVPVPKPVNPAPARTKKYTAVAGDNMTKIAAAHGMSLGLLKQLNPSAGHPARAYDNIWAGDVFVVSGTAEAPVVIAKQYDYIHPGGDNMTKLAERNHLSLQQLIALNPNAGHPAKDYDTVWPGDKFRVK